MFVLVLVLLLPPPSSCWGRCPRRVAFLVIPAMLTVVVLRVRSHGGGIGRKAWEFQADYERQITEQRARYRG